MLKKLIYYYGILQGFHILFLLIMLSNTEWILSFLNNSSLWSSQFINMFKAISVIDLINACLSIYFVYLYSKGIKSAKKLGIIVLSISVYSALIFGLGVFWNQLHIGNELILNLFSLPFIPVFYIWWKFVSNKSVD